jgi:hypothetical protein
MSMAKTWNDTMRDLLGSSTSTKDPNRIDKSVDLVLEYINSPKGNDDLVKLMKEINKKSLSDEDFNEIIKDSRVISAFREGRLSKILDKKD